MKNIFLFLSIALFMFSCKTYNEEEIESFDAKIQAYIKKNDLKMIKSDSGLYYQIHEEGEGEFIKPNAIILTSYEGKLLNGKVFDKQTKPVEMNLKNLIYGWREVAYYLKKGGKATIIVPPHLGYGDEDMDQLPASSIILFHLEIVDTY